MAAIENTMSECSVMAPDGPSWQPQSFADVDTTDKLRMYWLPGASGRPVPVGINNGRPKSLELISYHTQMLDDVLKQMAMGPWRKEDRDIDFGEMQALTTLDAVEFLRSSYAATHWFQQCKLDGPQLNDFP